MWPVCGASLFMESVNNDGDVRQHWTVVPANAE